MPELPDIVVYVESLESRVKGKILQHVRLLNPFILRTAMPPISAVEGKKVLELRRLGKRIVFELEGGLFLVVHLMIAGRLRWTDGQADQRFQGGLAWPCSNSKAAHCCSPKPAPKAQASLHLVEGEAGAR